MTEQNHHDPAELDKLTEKFTVLPNENPASDAKRAELIDKPAFGQVFSDNMAHMTWTKGEGWGDRRIEPYAPLKMDPGASVLHYAQVPKPAPTWPFPSPTTTKAVNLMLRPPLTTLVTRLIDTTFSVSSN